MSSIILRPKRAGGAACRRWLSLGCVALLAAISLGCRSQGSGNTETDAKVRLTQVLRLYNQQGPASEAALREFGQKLTPQERDEYLIGEDLESIFTSPRDNQKFEVRYGVVIDPSVTKALAWEATGKDGKRYVALTNLYVEEYDEETFQQYKQ
jgi:hypothetical protein